MMCTASSTSAAFQSESRNENGTAAKAFVEISVDRADDLRECPLSTAYHACGIKRLDMNARRSCSVGQVIDVTGRSLGLANPVGANPSRKKYPPFRRTTIATPGQSPASLLQRASAEFAAGPSGSVKPSTHRETARDPSSRWPGEMTMGSMEGIGRLLSGRQSRTSVAPAVTPPCLPGNSRRDDANVKESPSNRVELGWCGREDSNLHPVARTSS